MRLAPADTSAVKIASAAAPKHVALDAKYVYWTEGVQGSPGSVKRTLRDGTGGVETLASNQLNPGGIAVDATCVYWVNAGSSSTSSDGSVMKVVK